MAGAGPGASPRCASAHRRRRAPADPRSPRGAAGGSGRLRAGERAGPGSHPAGDMRGRGTPPMRTLFFYAQDSRGLGHINRTLAIVRPLLARYQDCVAYIATRSPIGATFTLPERCDYIKLPSRLTPATAVETPEEEEEARERFRRIRGRLLREAALALAPALVVGARGAARRGGEFPRRSLRAPRRAPRHPLRLRPARHHGRRRPHPGEVAGPRHLRRVRAALRRHRGARLPRALTRGGGGRASRGGQRK